MLPRIENWKVIPRPQTQDELKDMFVFKYTADGGMIGHFPFRNNPQDGGNEAEEKEEKEDDAK